MLLSARILNSVSDQNHFDVVQTLEATQGDLLDLYVQLIDASVEKNRDPLGRRYVPRAGSMLQVTIQDIDSSVTVVKSATQPWSGDLSVWRVAFDPVVDAAAVAGLVGTYGLKLKLTEPGSPTRVLQAFVQQALTVARASPEF